jgi:hypothetical protein
MDNKYLKVTLDNIEVWCVATQGVKGSATAFNKLESELSNLRSRHFYGVLEGSSVNGIYRACVAKEQNDYFKNLESWVIPGGKYVRVKIKDWERNINSIALTFSQMAKTFAVDNTRPSIEFYKSQKELVLMLPIT